MVGKGIPMETEDFAADAALFARMRAMWQDVDPVPADLVDRMVATASSGIGTGVRVARSISTEVCVAVTISSSSGRR